MKHSFGRLNEREIQATKTAAHALFHMVKLLDQKGLCLEEFFRFSDIEVTGRVSRNAFEKIIRNVGLSCNSKDLARIVAYYSEGIKFDIVNYHAFLKDADVQIKNEQKQHTSVKDLPSSIQRTWSARIRVLLDVRCMLMEVTSKMKRQKDFVTGMFTKWDSDMIGSVTSIQLIRVLIQLRVILTEKDQDILIGFLDSTSSGRVDYKYLLEFCFPKFDSKLSIISNIPDSQNNADLKQIKFPGKIQNGCDRIIVVQPSAVPISDQIDHGHPNKDHIHPMNSAKVVGNISESPVLVSYVEEHTFEQHQVTHNLPLLCPDNQCIEKTSIDKKLHLRNGGFSEASNLQRDIFAPMLDTLEQGYTINNSKVESEENDYQDESFDVSLSENEIFEGDVGSLESIEANATFGRFQNMISDCSHDTNRTIHGTNAEFIALKIKQGRMRNQGELREDDSFLRPSSDGDDVFNVGCKYQAAEDLSAEGDPRTLGPSSDNMPSEEDLRFSANKTLSTVRDMVLVRHRAGKPLTEIFRHFDRIGKNFFDAKDFLIATADLRINISNRVAAIAVELIALDGREHVSLGEFLVYILDPNHRILQDSIVKQMAEQLDKQGRVFQTLFRSLFRDKVKPLNRALLQADGFISIRAFLSSLRKLGLALTQIDISRLVRRFDTNGTGITCSAVRFIHMIEKSDVWEESEGILVDHEIALNESAMLRTQLVSIQHSNDITSQLDILNSRDIDEPVDLDLDLDLDEDMICMAEYLGIKVISEPHLLWIVRDAVTSQLPSPWILKKHNTGRSCYFNQDTDVTTWSHPLDQQFRILRDQHRLKSIPREIVLPRDLKIDQLPSVRTPTDPTQVYNNRSNSPTLVRSLSSDEQKMSNQSIMNDTFKQRLTVSEKTSEGLLRELKRGKQWQLPQQKEYWALNILNSRASKDFETHAFGMPFPSTLNNFNRSSRDSSRDSSTYLYDINRKDKGTGKTPERLNERERPNDWNAHSLPSVPNLLNSCTNPRIRPILTSKSKAKANLVWRKHEISQTGSATWASPSVGSTNFTTIDTRIAKTSSVICRSGENNRRKEKKGKYNNCEMKADLSVVDRLMILNENRKSCI